MQSNSNEKEEISHEFDSKHGQNYKEKEKREQAVMLAAASGFKRLPAPPTQSAPPVQQSSWEEQLEVPSPRPIHQPTTALPVQAPPPGAIIIEDKQIPVEIAVDVDGSTFSVEILAASVEVNNDGVSVLVDNKIKVKPPVLVPLKIIVSGAPYNVVYAGGTHAFGAFRNISFVRAASAK